MKDNDFDKKSDKAPPDVPPSPIPGDPFPWQPDPAADAQDPEPGDSGIYPIDLGGGD